MPWLDTSKVRSTRYRPVYRWFFWAFVLTCFVLGYLGSQPPEGWYLILGRVFTFYYFAFFLVVMPVLGRIEKPRALPDSIADSMRRGKKQSVGKASQAVGGRLMSSDRCLALAAARLALAAPLGARAAESRSPPSQPR